MQSLAVLTLQALLERTGFTHGERAETALPGRGLWGITRRGPYGAAVVRIIAGTLGGRRLDRLSGTSTRPTPERVREALFSRIEARFGIRDRDVLDLFAGTGALGIEALSRGASRLVCVEAGAQARRVLAANISKLGLEDRAEVMGEDAAKAMARLSLRGVRFGGVMLDPPYGKGLAEEALADLDRLDLVEPGGWVSVEVAKDDPLPEKAGQLGLLRQDTYGDTKLALYARPLEGEVKS